MVPRAPTVLKVGTALSEECLPAIVAVQDSPTNQVLSTVLRCRVTGIVALECMVCLATPTAFVMTVSLAIKVVRWHPLLVISASLASFRMNLEARSARLAQQEGTNYRAERRSAFSVQLESIPIKLAFLNVSLARRVMCLSKVWNLARLMSAKWGSTQTQGQKSA